MIHKSTGNLSEENYCTYFLPKVIAYFQFLLPHCILFLPLEQLLLHSNCVYKVIFCASPTMLLDRSRILARYAVSCRPLVPVCSQHGFILVYLAEGDCIAFLCTCAMSDGTKNVVIKYLPFCFLMETPFHSFYSYLSGDILVRTVQTQSTRESWLRNHQLQYKLQKNCY